LRAPRTQEKSEVQTKRTSKSANTEGARIGSFGLTYLSKTRAFTGFKLGVSSDSGMPEPQYKEVEEEAPVADQKTSVFSKEKLD